MELSNIADSCEGQVECTAAIQLPVAGEDVTASQQIRDGNRATEVSNTEDPSPRQHEGIMVKQQPAADEVDTAPPPQDSPQQMHDSNELSNTEDVPHRDGGITSIQQPAGAADTQPGSILEIINIQYFDKGSLVDVQSRTWPGINRPGGRARVVDYHTKTFYGDDDLPAEKITHVDVSYVVGRGREKRVNIEYVKPYFESDTSRNTQGRCPKCNSFLIDCNYCFLNAQKVVLRTNDRKQEKDPDGENKEDRQPSLGGDDDLVDTDVESDMDSDEEERVSLAYLERLKKRKEEILKRKGDRAPRRKRSGLNAASKTRPQPETSKVAKGDGMKSSARSAPSDSLDTPNFDSSDSDDIPLIALNEAVDAPNVKASEVRKKKRRKHVKGSLESLPGATTGAESASSNGSSEKADKDNENSTRSVDNAAMDNSDDDEVEILHTPRKDFLFDQDLENNNVNESVAAEPEELLTPRAMDEDIDFEENDETSFRGDKEEGEVLLTPRPLDECASVGSDTNDDVIFEGDPDYDSEYIDNESNSCEMEVNSENESDDDSTDDQYVAPPKVVKYEDLLESIGNLASELETTTIPDAKQKYTSLKLRLSLWEDKNKLELLSIKQESYKLHKEIVQKLIREGIDTCNQAMIRFVKERKSSDECRTCYRKSRASKERTEALLCQVEMDINVVDNQVNAFRKEIDELWSDMHDAYLGGGEEADSSSYLTHKQAKNVRRQITGDAEYDQHQHASRKRKPASHKTSHNKRRESSGNSENTTKRRKSSVGGPETAKGDRKRQRIDDEYVNVDFIGETNENTRPFNARQTNDQRKMASRGRQRTLGSLFRPAQSRSISRPAQNDSERLINAQTSESCEGTTFNQQSKLNDLNNRRSKSGDRTMKEHSVHATLKRGNEPSLPASMSVEHIMKSLSKLNGSSKECTYKISSYTKIAEPVQESCAALVQDYPNNIQRCKSSVSKLMHQIKGELHDDEVVVAIFHSLHTVFQKKCSTFLDLLCTDASDACFQISCWSLVFQMMREKLHLRLQEKDGVLYNVFGNATSLAGHIVIQMIDCFYSQLLWQEYGATSRFDGQVFKCLDQLRDNISLVVPLLPMATDLLRSKFGCQSWHRSKMADQKENDLAASYFVSSINPDDHVRFLSTGQNVTSPEGGSRLSKLGRNTSRREIHAMWFVICYFSSNPTHATSDDKKTISMLSSIVHSNCGIFPKDQPPSELPAHKEHISTCCKEIEWIATLISCKSLGYLPDLDGFLSDLIQNAVQLESRDNRLCCLTSFSNGSIEQLVRTSWHAACRVEDVELPSFLVADERSVGWGLAPSTRLLQSCSLALKSYASLAIQKKAKCKRLTGSLNALISAFDNKALEFEANEDAAPETTVNVTDEVDDFGNAFASAFTEINEFTRDRKVDTPHAAYFRESACCIILSVLSARRESTAAGIDIGLNKATRERLLMLSSDGKTRSCQMHYIERKSGKAPPCSNNLCSLYMSAKVLYSTAMLHLFGDGRKESHTTLTNLEMHLATLGLDTDINMLQYLVAGMIAPLLGCCDVQETLSKDMVDSTKDCLEVIRSISLSVSCIYQRAHSILDASPSEDLPSNVKVIADAILKLGSAKFSCFILNSLTRVLDSIISTLPFRLSSSATGVLKTAFRSCLVAMRMVIGLVHKIRKSELYIDQASVSSVSKALFADACNSFQLFMTSRIMPSLVTINAFSHDRILCRSQSSALIAVYAAFLTLRNDRLDVDVFKLIAPTQTLVDDDTPIFLKQLRACFSCELTLLSNFQCCKLSRELVKCVLDDAVTSLLDSETLMMFPSKISQASQTGGSDLRHPLSHQNPDDEAIRIIGIQVECLDAVGPEYMSKNIWSFCVEAGKLLESENVYKDIGHVLIGTCTSLRFSQDLLKMVPSISCERECMKRLILSWSILTKSSETNLQVSSTILNAILENLYRLIGIGLYHEKQHNDCEDKTSRLDRRRAMVFQKSYVQLSGSLLALMLRENAIVNSDQCDFVRDVLVTRSFAATSTLKDIIEIAHEKQVGNALLFQFSLRKKIGSVTESEQFYLKRMTRDLCLTFLSRADDLLVHAVHCHSTGGTKAILHSIMSATLMQQADHMKSFAAIACDVLVPSTSLSIIKGRTISRNDLQTAINGYIHTEIDGCGATQDSRAVANYRNWVIDPFLTYRLSSPHMPPCYHKGTLEFLAGLLEKMSVANITCDENGYAKIAHALKVCLCNQYKAMDAGFMQLWMNCATALLILREPKTVAATDEQMKSTLAYSAAFSNWLKLISTLSMQEIPVLFDTALNGAVDNVMQPNSSPQTEALKSCHESMIRIERILFPNESVPASNPYAKKM